MNYVHVLGEVNGPLDADILFVAEAPGRLGAARTGVPMTLDVTGRRFHAFLADAGIPRERVFITNAVLCNPLTANGHNRRPTAAEVAACGDFLAAQLRLVRAPIVVALGGVALEALRRIEPHDAVLVRDAGRALPFGLSRSAETSASSVEPRSRRSLRTKPWAARLLVPLYHPSIQSTLSRPHVAQLEDWRRLRQLWRGMMSRRERRWKAIPRRSSTTSSGRATAGCWRTPTPSAT